MSVYSAIPQLDNELRAERSVAGMKTRLEGGRWTFKAPLGYINGRDHNNGKTLLHDPKRAPLITKAFELFGTGLYNREQVRQRINAEGLRTHEGKPVGPEAFAGYFGIPDTLASLLWTNGELLIKGTSRQS